MGGSDTLSISTVGEVSLLSCYSPLKCWCVGVKDSGKSETRVTAYGVDHLEFYGGNWHASDISMRSSLADRVCRDYVEIPCGKCIGCRLDYSRRWADRCMIENIYHDSSYFLTLTYDNEHVPITCYFDPDTGEAFESMSLRKRDLQLFHKRLRKKLDYQIRFFACGEYGNNTFRPHYHSIEYGLKIPDLKPYKKSKLGYQYYTSEWMNDIWQQGYVVIGEVNWETCAYTARYIMKKHLGKDADWYENFNIEPEFTLMSRKPGIANQYYQDHKDELINGEEIFISTEKGGKQLRTPKYYDSYFELDFPDKYDIIKMARQEKALDHKSAVLKKTDLDYMQYLDICADKAERRLNSLIRPEF